MVVFCRRHWVATADAVDALDVVRARPDQSLLFPAPRVGYIDLRNFRTPLREVVELEQEVLGVGSLRRQRLACLEREVVGCDGASGWRPHRRAGTAATR
jgi:hypothetical protein